MGETLTEIKTLKNSCLYEGIRGKKCVHKPGEAHAQKWPVKTLSLHDGVSCEDLHLHEPVCKDRESVYFFKC